MSAEHVPQRLPSAGLSRRGTRSFSLIPRAVALPRWVGFTLMFVALATVLARRAFDAEVGLLEVAVFFAAVVLTVGGAFFAAWWARENRHQHWYAITVGDEGFWIRRPAGAGRLVSFADVVAIVDQSPRELTLIHSSSFKPQAEVQKLIWYRCRVRLASRGAIRLCSAEPGLSMALKDALTFYQSQQPPPEISLLAAPGDDFDQWLSTLETLLSKTGDYRSARVSTEQLTDIVDHPKAAAGQRIAAAIALGAAGPEERDRVERAAASTADPALAAALRAALSGTLDRKAFAKAE